MHIQIDIRCTGAHRHTKTDTDVHTDIQRHTQTHTFRDTQRDSLALSLSPCPRKYPSTRGPGGRLPFSVEDVPISSSPRAPGPSILPFRRASVQKPSGSSSTTRTGKRNIASPASLPCSPLGPGPKGRHESKIPFP